MVRSPRSFIASCAHSCVWFLSSLSLFVLVSKNVLFCVARNSTQFWSNKAIPKCPRSDSCVLRILLAVLQKQFSDSSNGGQSTHKLRTDRRKKKRKRNSFLLASFLCSMTKRKTNNNNLFFSSRKRENSSCFVGSKIKF